MNKLYPLKFIADPRERVWGGEYLAKDLKKSFDEEFAGKPIGESWELWSLYGGSSVVQNGFLAGNTLDELMEIYLGDLVGENVFSHYGGDFPLLVKILDIKDRISVQVHPNDEIAFEREDSYGKAELWYILHADPGAKLYVGFNKEVTPGELYEKCKDGTVTEVLNSFSISKGDCIYIQPGCIHSAEGEVIIAEIQQSSDITYRLYDWGRENNPKTARRMDLEDAIDVIDYSKFDNSKYHFKKVTGNKTVVDTSHFIVKTLELSSPTRVIPSEIGSFIVYMCVDGEAVIKMNDGTEYTIIKGETIFIPASMEDFQLIPGTNAPQLLQVHMPQLTEERDPYLNYDDDSEADNHHHCGCDCHHHHEEEE